MYQNKDSVKPPFLFNIPKTLGSLEPDEELLQLEEELRRRNLLHAEEVQWLIGIARIPASHNGQWATDQNDLGIRAYYGYEDW